ncbi:hypothetical protein [Halopseudomonas sp.]|uniref:hypothetical protein n=1 Tax=Halopseudomonas sp. TaxID=2901191 RepID=UPI0031202DAE
MTFDVQIVDVIGWIFGAGGILIALYQIREGQKVRDFVRSEAWATYSRTNDIVGKIQKNLKIYREKHKENIDPDVLETLTRSDALALELFYDAIRQVKYAEPKFNIATIEYWNAVGKISDPHKTDFYHIVVGGEPSTANKSRQQDALKARASA